MNPAVRLGQIVTQLEKVGISCLVMGGHAVRYYGLQRYTNDFDLHLAPETWPDLVERLRSTELFAGAAPEEGPSWRPNDFRRFRIGALPNGGDEWLEFWRANHLLAPFTELAVRSESGNYGDRLLRFLSLPDLILSKETERDKDWGDVAILEELYDARLLRQVSAGELSLSRALAQLRSRRGIEAFVRHNLVGDAAIVTEALRTTTLALTQALLLPFAPKTDALLTTTPMENVVANRLRTIEPSSPLHFALVEIVRRQHRHVRQAADREDKMRVRSTRTTTDAGFHAAPPG